MRLGTGPDGGAQACVVDSRRRFDLDGRHYRARIYTDTPDEADVMGTDGTRHPQHEEDLRVIDAYLRNEVGVRTVLTLGGSGGFEPEPERG
jgi:hypothetical protein